MSSRIVYRLSGLALLLGSLLVVPFTIILFVVFPHGTLDRYTSPLWQPILVLMLLGVLLIMGGLPGMYVLGWINAEVSSELPLPKEALLDV